MRILEAQVILQATQTAKQESIKPKSHFVEMPATWINQQRKQSKQV